MSKELLKASIYAITAIEEIIKHQATLDEEWDVLLKFIKEAAKNEYIKCNKASSLSNILTIARDMYIVGQYKGDVNELMSTYLELKGILNDPVFDAIYLNYLGKSCNDKKLETEMLNFIGTELWGSNEYRIRQIFESLGNLYLDIDNLEKQEVIERIIVKNCKEWVKELNSIECKLNLINLLKTIAMNTISPDNLFEITQTLIKLAVEPTDKSFPKRIYTTGSTLEKSVIEVLFKLFYYFYTKMPVSYLRHVFNSFLELIEKGSKQMQLLSLQLLSNIGFDAEYYICIKDCNVSSYLNLKEDVTYNVTPDRIAVIIFNLIYEVKDKELIIAGLEALMSLTRSHYALKALDLTNFLNRLIEFLFTIMFDEKEIEVVMKVGELIELILLQKGPSSDTKSSLNDDSWIIISLNNFIDQVEDLLLIPSVEGFGILKSNEETKKSNKGDKQFLEALILLMRIMGSIVYVGKEEFVALIQRYIFFLKQYMEQSVLDKKIANEIQYFVSDLHYSNFLSLLSEQDLALLLDLCLKLGWHNSLCVKGGCQDFINGNNMLNLKAQVIGEIRNDIEISDRGVHSKLLFPNINYKPVLKSKSEKISSKKRVEIKYLVHQNDNEYTMHTITLGAISIFTAICKKPFIDDKVTKVDLLGYLAYIVNNELDNKNSPITQYSIILLELAEWYCFGNVERSISSKPLNKKKLWIMNDNIMSIQTEGLEATIEVRNIVSYSSFTIKLNESLLHRPIKESLALLRTKKTSDIVPSIDPEFVMHYFSSLMPIQYRALLWQSIQSTPEVETLISELDEVPVYDCYSIAALYIPKTFTLIEDEIYEVKDWSERFEAFLSSLGTCNGIDNLLWQDEFTKVVIHSSIFCTVKENKEIMKEQIRSENIWVIWNDYNKKLPLELFKNRKILIILEPLEDKYCIINTFDVILYLIFRE